MLRAIIIALFATAALAHVDPRKLPTEFQDLVPRRVKSFYEQLSEGESAVIDKVMKEHDYWKSPHEFLNALNESSPSAYVKAVELHEDTKYIMSNLSEPAKKFAQNLEKVLFAMVGGELKPDEPEQMRKAAKVIVKKYDALSAEDKENFKDHFVQVAQAIEGEPLRKIAKKPEGGDSSSSSESSEEKQKKDQAEQKEEHNPE
ncbi:fatty acid and retinol binding protein [Aphelenchoides avenae]|nr:fatty acid and retinol binding protein [Aphelenchus avenae]